jgi:hypothetical protein
VSSAWSSVLFVFQDDDQRETFLDVADRELTGHLWHRRRPRATSTPDATGRSSRAKSTCTPATLSLGASHGFRPGTPAAPQPSAATGAPAGSRGRGHGRGGASGVPLERGSRHRRAPRCRRAPRAANPAAQSPVRSTTHAGASHARRPTEGTGNAALGRSRLDAMPLTDARQALTARAPASARDPSARQERSRTVAFRPERASLAGERRRSQVASKR